MSFGRRLLDSFGFVRPAETNSYRAQIPKTFFDFASACGEINIPQANDRNIVINGAELIAVYGVLRNRPPSHRWRGDDVKREMQKCGLGKNKVQAILKLLNDQGWIRYINLPSTAGKVGGVVIEVLYRRLTSDQAGIRRNIQFDGTGNIQVFEMDGETEVSSDYPQTFLVPDEVPEHPYGKEEEPQSWLPYNQPSGTRLSDVRSPGDRQPGEQYKDLSYKEHTLEEAPVSPQAAPGDIFSSDKESGEMEDIPAKSDSSDGSMPVPAVPIAEPSAPLDLPGLCHKLHVFGRLAQDSPEDKNRYEELVLHEVVPRLDDPPIPGKWTAAATEDWGKKSLKAELLLAICGEGSWPASLLRSFGKRCGEYSSSDFRMLLLNFDWNRRPRPSLECLVKGGKSRASLDGWKQLLVEAREKFNWRRILWESFRSELQPQSRDHDRSMAEGLREKLNSGGPSFLRGEPNEEDVFEWLSAVWIQGKQASASSLDGSIEQVQRRHRNDLLDYIVISRSRLALASLLHGSVEEIWGVSWQEIRDRHLAMVESFNRYAEIFGEETAQPLHNLLDHPLGSPNGGDRAQELESANKRATVVDPVVASALAAGLKLITPGNNQDAGVEVSSQPIVTTDQPGITANQADPVPQQGVQVGTSLITAVPEQEDSDSTDSPANQNQPPFLEEAQDVAAKLLRLRALSGGGGGWPSSQK